MTADSNQPPSRPRRFPLVEAVVLVAVLVFLAAYWREGRRLDAELGKVREGVESLESKAEVWGSLSGRVINTTEIPLTELQLKSDPPQDAPGVPDVEFKIPQLESREFPEDR